jgi:hypothetical protein
VLAAPAVLALAVGLAFVYFRSRRRLPRVRASPVHRSEGPLTELARLDDDFRIAEEAYHKARARKKAELVKLMERSKEVNGNK